MKRLFLSLLVAAVSLFCADTLSAQHKFGVIGGATFSHANFREFSRGTVAQYHAGITYRASLPLGFSIQPSLIYQVKGAMTASDGVNANATIGYLELPVSFQWGPDLILFRPFLDVSPFVGYALNNELAVTSPAAQRSSLGYTNKWDGVNRLEYGLGLGGGLEIWKVQVVCRYNWNFGQLFDTSGKAAATADFFENAKESVFNEKNFGGVTLSVALLF